jgi:hypothetical protein
MVKKSNDVILADEMQAWFSVRLKQLGFRVKGRTYNRLNVDGLTEVIDISLGRADPLGTIHMPDSAVSTYGHFAIGLGIFVPEVHKHLNDWKLGNIITQPNCCVHGNLGTPWPGSDAQWWKLVRDETLYSSVFSLLERDGMHFLERFSSRSKILKEWEAQVENTPESLSPPKLACAMIYFERGDMDAASRLLREQAKDADHKFHRDYVNKLAIRLNLHLD